MASFVRDAGSNLTPVLHEAALFHEHLELFSLKGMMGKKGSGSSIIVDTTLKTEAGDTKMYHYVPFAFSNFEEDAILGQDATILGNEKKLEEFSFDLTVNEVNYPLRKKGKMTDQRTVWEITPEMRRQVTEVFAHHNENVIFRAWSGVSLTEKKVDFESATDTTDRVNGAGRAIQADGPSGSTEVSAANSDNTALAASMDTNDIMNTRLIEDAVIMARTSGKFKQYPIRVGPNNEEFFILICSLKAGRDLRRDPEWVNHALSAMEAGLGGDMIASGALGVWDNVIVKTSERILEFDDGSDRIARNLLIGRDSAVLGWAQTLAISLERIDHGRELSVNGGEIRGEAKVTFDSVDMGVSQVLTASN